MGDKWYKIKGKKQKATTKTEEITIMWYRNKVKPLKKAKVLNWKLAKCFLVFMICISIEILGRFSEDVYVKGDKYILVKTKHPGRIDRRQKTVFRFKYIQQVWPPKKWIWVIVLWQEIMNLSCGFSLGRNIPKWRFTSFPDPLCLQWKV